MNYFTSNTSASNTFPYNVNSHMSAGMPEFGLHDFQNEETIANFDEKNKKTAGQNFNGVEVALSDENNNDDCSVCLGPLKENGPVKGTSVCEHIFHEKCLKDVLKQSHKCPVCRAVIIEKLGPCPNGYMKIITCNTMHCAGYKDCGTIQIDYDLFSGTQGPQHENPGAWYGNDYREAYLPDNKAGRRVLELFKKAWKMKLTFTVGTSLSSGQRDVVTWNDIHHKTSLNGGPYGYPDATYLERVAADMHALGVRLDE